MEIMIINASPRKSGNTSYLADEALKILNRHGIQPTYINLRTLDFEPCIACGYCDKTGKCFMKDDMTPLYEKINKSCGTIVLSPVFFDGVPAKLKAFVDRTQAFYASKYILNEPSIDRYKKRFGLLVSLGGAKPYETQFVGNKAIMEFYFRCINTKLLNHLQISDIDNSPVWDREDFLKNYKNEIEELIKNMKASMC